MPYVGIFVKHTLCACIEINRKFCEPGQREDNLKSTHGVDGEFSDELTF